MGNNHVGQLGDPPIGTTNSPDLIVASNVTAIAAGGSHSLFLKSNGSLWAMGDNAYGQLGNGTYNNTNRPVQIMASNVTAIAAGYGHSLFLKSDGSLWGMGDNLHGQLGDGTYNSTNLPVQIAVNEYFADHNDEADWCDRQMAGHFRQPVAGLLGLGESDQCHQ